MKKKLEREKSLNFLKLHRIQTKEDLYNCLINEKILNKYIFILFVFSACVPLAILIENIFNRYSINDYNEKNFMLYSFDIISYNYFWYVMIQIIGYLCIIGSILYIAANFHKKKEKSVTKISATLFFVFLLFSWCLLAAFFSTNISVSILGNFFRHEGILTYIAYLGFFLCAFLLNDEYFVRKYLVLFSVSASIVLLPIAISNNDLNAFLNLNLGLTNSIFNNSNHSGYYNCLLVMTCGVVYLIYNGNCRFIKYVLFSLFMYAVFTQLRNGSFGSYFSEAIGLIVLLLLIAIQKKYNYDLYLSYIRKGTILLLIFIVISICYSVYNNWLTADILGLFPSLKNLISGTKKEQDRAGSGRGILILRAIQFVKERPLFGYGPDNLYDEYLKYNIEEDRAHCVPLNIAASEGIPAAMFYLGALVTFLIGFIRKFRNLNILDIGLFSIGTAYFCSSLVGNSSYYVTPYFCIIFGLASGRITRTMDTVQMQNGIRKLFLN